MTLRLRVMTTIMYVLEFIVTITGRIHYGPGRRDIKRTGSDILLPTFEVRIIGKITVLLSIFSS